MATHGSKPPSIKILSAGQTSSERAAITVARELGIPCAGRCRAAPGSAAYLRCITRNARCADGTIVVTRNRLPRMRSAVMLAIWENSKVGLLGGVEIEFTKKWIRRKRILKVLITGHAPMRQTVEYLRAVFDEGIR